MSAIWQHKRIQRIRSPTTEICFFRHSSPTTRTCRPANPVMIFICKLYPDAKASKTCSCICGGKFLVAVMDCSTSESLSAPIEALRLEVRWLFMTLEAIAKPKAPPNTRNWSNAPLEMANCPVNLTFGMESAWCLCARTYQDLEAPQDEAVEQVTFPSRYRCQFQI